MNLQEEHILQADDLTVPALEFDENYYDNLQKILENTKKGTNSTLEAAKKNRVPHKGKGPRKPKNKGFRASKINLQKNK